MKESILLSIQSSGNLQESVSVTPRGNSAKIKAGGSRTSSSAVDGHGNSSSSITYPKVELVGHGRDAPGGDSKGRAKANSSSAPLSINDLITNASNSTTNTNKEGRGTSNVRFTDTFSRRLINQNVSLGDSFSSTHSMGHNNNTSTSSYGSGKVEGADDSVEDSIRSAPSSLSGLKQYHSRHE
jgi:hypothetical protein